MRTAPLIAPSHADHREGFFVHRIQKVYMVWIGLLLFLYSSLFFTVAFYGAHLKPLLALYGSGSLEERQAAAAEMLRTLHLVNAAGLWAREVGAMAGVYFPLLPMAHQYLVTDDIPERRGTLHAALGLSPVARGRLLSADLELLRAQPGVVDVFLAADIPGGAAFRASAASISQGVPFLTKRWRNCAAVIEPAKPPVVTLLVSATLLSSDSIALQMGTSAKLSRASR